MFTYIVDGDGDDGDGATTRATADASSAGGLLRIRWRLSPTDELRVPPRLDSIRKMSNRILNRRIFIYISLIGDGRGVVYSGRYDILLNSMTFADNWPSSRGRPLYLLNRQPIARDSM